MHNVSSEPAPTKQSRPLYMVPFGAAVVTVIGVFLLGAAGGALGSWLTVRRMLRVAPGGERIIERVERVSVEGEEALGTAVADVVPGVAGLLDERGKIFQQAVAVTADGVLATSGDAPNGSVSVRRADGDVVPASIVRAYPEAGVVFLKTSGSFPVPTLDRDGVTTPGAAGAIAVSASENAGFGVHMARVGVVRHAADVLHARRQALDRMPVLDRGFPPSFQGAPFVTSTGRVAGLILLERDGAYVLPSAAIDRLLQDYLQHTDEAIVSVLTGLRGRWTFGSDSSSSGEWVISEAGAGSRFASVLRSGDTILKANGSSLDGSLPLMGVLLEATRSGNDVTLDVRRGGETLSVQLPPVS